jgi:Cu(I)/Ag(I) efflux system membrane fusion protein
MRIACRLFLLLSWLPLSALAQPKTDFSKHIPDFEQNVRYVCPMHSHITKDHEGTCPICGMQLVARELNTRANIEVQVSGAMQQAMAITTEVVERGRLWRFINTYGSVQFDETGLMHLHPRASGWIEKLTVNSLGQRIKKDELLYEIYAPALLVAQEDFLSLLSSQNISLALMERGRQRLRLLGFNDQLISQLEKTRQVLYRVPYYAQQDGIISALEVREGMYAEASNRILTLADLSRVWVIADVFEHQIDWVSVGNSVELDLPALDLYKLRGSVEFIYPTLNPVTRTLQVRLALDNPQERLKPDMLATVRIFAGPVDTLNISIDALIQTEKHNRVFVQSSDGSFQRRDVDVGIVTNDRAEILNGLVEGDKVVTSGQFLLDAEASLSNIATTNIVDHQH